jgi:hypothetical protein
MAWEGYRWRLCKCNDFNVYGLFGRDKVPMTMFFRRIEPSD